MEFLIWIGWCFVDKHRCFIFMNNRTQCISYACGPVGTTWFLQSYNQRQDKKTYLHNSLLSHCCWWKLKILIGTLHSVFFLVHRYFSVLTNTHRLWPMVRSKFLIRTHHKYVASEFYLLFLCVCIRNENVTLRVNISTWQKTKLNKKENKQTETVKTKWMEEFVQFERRIRILWKTKKNVT